MDSRRMSRLNLEVHGHRRRWLTKIGVTLTQIPAKAFTFFVELRAERKAEEKWYWIFYRGGLCDCETWHQNWYNFSQRHVRLQNLWPSMGIPTTSNCWSRTSKFKSLHLLRSATNCLSNYSTLV
ncbi:PREDICTED: uncharacterized protein LOC104741213 [Camelina sativa]|uniref:Uncharacterized protein LOC104741213 n=1 Tax=Camelina sativa TaxID=90675 RepID=A0ABM0VS33_CAMSA|nr:PREDICTED: uncharacterized protein LOC104741213 [Camelina sativa]